MYTFADLQTELDTRFEPSVRDTFDHYKRLPLPLFVLIVNVNPQNGERYPAPTPCPIQLDLSSGPPTAHGILAGVKRMVVLTEAVASLVAYQMPHGVKVRAELLGQSCEWLIPILTDPKQKDHRYMGKRITYSHATGAHAKLLDELDMFGGLFEKLGKAAEA